MDLLLFATVVLGHHNDGDHMWGGGWMWLWGSLMMVFWVAVIGLAVYWIVRSTRSPREPAPGGRAKDILAERFARGEMTSDEYRERMEALE